MLDFGIVQGRLIQSPPNELQWFPGDKWFDEFVIAEKIGIKFIELLAEREFNKKNPLWSEKGRDEIKKASEKNNIKIYSTCTDYIINHGILGHEAELVKQNVKRFIDATAILKSSVVIFPLLEESNVTPENMLTFVQPIKKFAKYASEKNISIYLETLLKAEDLDLFLREIDQPNVYCVFDTGNRILESSDLSGEIKLLNNKIKHVHIKDKNSNGENVLLGTGKVNFYEIFQALSDINYSGPLVFETTRGSDPILTAKYQMNFCEFFYNEVQRN